VNLLEVINQDNGQILAYKAQTAYSFFRRLKGLMFTRQLPAGSAIHLHPCRSVHTYFMNYSIDVLYLDSEQRVIGMEEALHPGKAGRRYRKTVSVVELPAGTIRETQTMAGHALQFENEKERL
jgi:uncharacterized membrane protein (UPF0127 family)